jgi:hypothetical protein
MKNTKKYRNNKTRTLRKRRNMLGHGMSTECIKKLQRFLLSIPEERYLTQLKKPIDGVFGKITIQSLQTFLLSHELESGTLSKLKEPIDGKFGEKSVKSLQEFLLNHEPENDINILTQLKKPIDGRFGSKTMTSLEHWLDIQLSLLERKTIEEHKRMLRNYHSDFHSRNNFREKRAVLNNMFNELQYIINNPDIELDDIILIYDTYLKKSTIMWSNLLEITKSKSSEEALYNELMENYTITNNSFKKKMDEQIKIGVRLMESLPSIPQHTPDI